MLQADPGSVSFSLSAFLSALAGWAGGAVTTVLLFRARMDVAQANFSNLETRLREQREADRTRLELELREMRNAFAQQCTALSNESRALRDEFQAWTSEARGSLGKGMRDSARREEFLLELVLGIAHKNGVRHRLTDALVPLFQGDDLSKPEGG